MDARRSFCACRSLLPAIWGKGFFAPQTTLKGRTQTDHMNGKVCPMCIILNFLSHFTVLKQINSKHFLVGSTAHDYPLETITPTIPIIIVAIFLPGWTASACLARLDWRG